MGGGGMMEHPYGTGGKCSGDHIRHHPQQEPLSHFPKLYIEPL